ncbi:Protein sanA [Sulfurovum sp. enrichment culture clone C5]|uniref:Protein sanA n=1 Tax=Sulfurovum sp. enrichment culture clone C5 TaxID=497650 RepID=A0A0S4XMC9_9BACT|nr:Protein sanA [Sulfurovum sp. enrichment culture clone C5]
MNIISFGKIYDDFDKVPQKQTALLLGTTKYTSKHEVNPFYKYRIKTVVELYKKGKVKNILISGDSTSDRYYRETATMKKDLIANGVNPSDIKTDKKGIRTFDSIERAKDIYGVNDYIIVSQKFHLQRAIFLATARGDKAIGFVAPEDEGSKASKNMIVREFFARPIALLDLFGLSKLYEPWKKNFKDKF